MNEKEFLEKIGLILEKIMADTFEDKLTWERGSEYGVYVLFIGKCSITIDKKSLFTNNVNFAIYNEDGYCVYEDSFRDFVDDMKVYNDFFKKVEKDIFDKTTLFDDILKELNNSSFNE